VDFNKGSSGDINPCRSISTNDMDTLDIIVANMFYV
jgi:hypothetical protein